MSTITIAAAASSTISLAAGYQIAIISGSGIAVLGPGPQRGQQIGVRGGNTVGPFDRAQDVYLTATTALSYDADGPLRTPGLTPSLQVVDPATRSPVSGGGIPSAFTTRALTSADNGATLVAAGAAVAAVNTGFAAGFGCAFVGAGAVTFAGTATVNDYRTTGAANPSCALVQTGTDTYGVYGSKA